MWCGAWNNKLMPFPLNHEIIQRDFSKYKKGELRKFKSRGDSPFGSLYHQDCRGKPAHSSNSQMCQTLLCWTQTTPTSLRFAGLVNETKFPFLWWFPGNRTCQFCIPVLQKRLAELPPPRSLPQLPQTQTQEFSLSATKSNCTFPGEPWFQVGFLRTNKLHTQLMVFIK